MVVSHSLLSRQPARALPRLSLCPSSPDFDLAQGRMHEACGAARRSFAMWVAARCEGPIIWIAPQWAPAQLNAEGIRAWIGPARLLFVTPKRAEDMLWTMEEILRSGAAPLAIADLPALPGLTQVRRMHLAAETGTPKGQPGPIGLLLTPGEGGAPGVETRWHLNHRHAKGKDGWHLERLRARTAPRKSWELHRLSPQTLPQINTP